MNTQGNDSERWISYFKFNREHLRAIAWSHAYRLRPEEKAAIAESLRAFQLGESSDGDHFRKQAAQYAAQAQEPRYIEANGLFIAEEQRHARDLGRFMDLEGIPRANRHWMDTAFRRLRKLSGLELCISVLVTAEIIAETYYRALGEATRSPILGGLCRQILNDEIQHVVFQSSMLRKIRRARSPFLDQATYLLQRALMGATLAVVWLGHGKALRAGGYTLLRFVGEVLCDLEAAIVLMRGREEPALSPAIGEQTEAAIWNP